jgi:hypothetical protein
VGWAKLADPARREVSIACCLEHCRQIELRWHILAMQACELVKTDLRVRRTVWRAVW